MTGRAAVTNVQTARRSSRMAPAVVMTPVPHRARPSTHQRAAVSARPLIPALVPVREEAPIRIPARALAHHPRFYLAIAAPVRLTVPTHVQPKAKSSTHQRAAACARPLIAVPVPAREEVTVRMAAPALAHHPRSYLALASAALPTALMHAHLWANGSPRSPAAAV